MEVFCDGGDFRGIFFQDHHMKTVFDSYPEVLLFDATYKLTELRMPLYLLMAIDGNGHSEIVGLYLTVSETAASLKGMLQAFKKHNNSWTRTVVIMTDKDMTERMTLSEEFPEAALQLCLFHTLRSFKREFSLDKLGLRPGMRDAILDLLAKMAHAKSPQVFDEQYALFKALGVRPAIEFFDKNWLPIKEEWATCYKNEKFTLGELTNNRLESMNGKIKSVCSKFASLDTFFSEFFDVLRVLRGERTHSHIMQRIKVPAMHQPQVTPEGAKYANYVTPYAYTLIVTQLLLRDAVRVPDDGRLNTSEGPITVTASSCQCSFWVTRKLPCRHVFAYRKMKRLPSFDTDLVSDRWSASRYEAVCGQKLTESVGSVGITASTATSTSTVMSSHQKYATALSVAKDLASLASEVGMACFTERLAFLQDVRRSWAQGSTVTMHSTCEYWSCCDSFGFVQ